jgi:hypothetical protein
MERLLREIPAVSGLEVNKLPRFLRKVIELYINFHLQDRHPFDVFMCGLTSLLTLE